MLSKEQSTITDVAEGVTKGVVSWGEEKIKNLAHSFLDKQLIFINNRATIDLVKEQLKSGDWSLCEQYLKDKRIRLLVQLGLTLRKLESKPEQLQDLRNKILNKYQEKGLHIAQVVQNNILTEFIGSIASKVYSGRTDMIEKVETLLSEVDKLVLFIRVEDNIEKKINEINIRLQANNPDAIILFSSKSAMETCKQIKNGLDNLENYNLESKEEKNKYLVFVFRKPTSLFE